MLRAISFVAVLSLSIAFANHAWAQNAPLASPAQNVWGPDFHSALPLSLTPNSARRNPATAKTPVATEPSSARTSLPADLPHHRPEGPNSFSIKRAQQPTDGWKADRNRIDIHSWQTAGSLSTGIQESPRDVNNAASNSPQSNQANKQNNFNNGAATDAQDLSETDLQPIHPRPVLSTALPTGFQVPSANSSFSDPGNYVVTPNTLIPQPRLPMIAGPATGQRGSQIGGQQPALPQPQRPISAANIGRAPQSRALSPRRRVRRAGISTGCPIQDNFLRASGL